jgi:hypothetical protein
MTRERSQGNFARRRPLEIARDRLHQAHLGESAHRIEKAPVAFGRGDRVRVPIHDGYPRPGRQARQDLQGDVAGETDIVRAHVAYPFPFARLTGQGDKRNPRLVDRADGSGKSRLVGGDQDYGGRFFGEGARDQAALLLDVIGLVRRAVTDLVAELRGDGSRAKERAFIGGIGSVLGDERYVSHGSGGAGVNQ